MKKPERRIKPVRIKVRRARRGGRVKAVTDQKRVEICYGKRQELLWEATDGDLVIHFSRKDSPWHAGRYIFHVEQGDSVGSGVPLKAAARKEPYVYQMWLIEPVTGALLPVDPSVIIKG
ncbi:MAG: hypothetical protein HZB25_12620 [Candidatus Eisenbacteria bacterium]|nr:hypothetical protein [Candidatus Eisenbacteria bacterium]